MKLLINNIEIDLNSLVKHTIEFNQCNQEFVYEVYQYKGFYIGTTESLDRYILKCDFILSDRFNYVMQLSNKLNNIPNKSAWFAVDLKNEDMVIYKVELQKGEHYEENI